MITHKMTDAVSSFADAAKKHYEYTIEGDARKINRQAKRLRDSFRKIQDLGDEARDLLLVEMDNSDYSIAVNAAAYSLKYSTIRAQDVLVALSKTPGIVGFQAEQVLERWKEGNWQLE